MSESDRAIRILIITDERSRPLIHRADLGRAGFEVVELVSPGDLVTAAVGEHPDVLVVLDADDAAAAEQCRRLKADVRSVHIPLLHIATGADVPDDAPLCADGFLVTPVSSAVMIAAVLSLMRIRIAETRLSAAVERERRAREAAETASRIKDQFLATLSHELRTPLNTMAGWLWRLRQPGVTPDVLERALVSLERNTRIQTQMVEDLLDVSRIVTGKLHLDLEPVALTTVIRSAVDMLQPSIDAKSLALTLSFEADAVVNGDARRLHQIVVNLVSNAIRCTPAGGRIDVALTRDGGVARLIVRDTGVGIDAETLPHVFQPFRQADVRQSHGGLGLGLAIVRQIATMHGGQVAAASAGKGLGATFTIDLPLAAGDTLAAEGDGGHADYSLDGIRVLLVEDDPDARDLLAAMMTFAGADVAARGLAADAIALWNTGGFHVLVSDLGLPHMDGFELVRRLRLSAGPIPAVAVSAYATQADRDRAHAAGFAAHVAKPVDPIDLVETVARVAANRKQG